MNEDSYGLHDFLSVCRTVLGEDESASAIVRRLAPAMHALTSAAPGFLTTDHRRSDRDHYARNLIHAEPDGTFSLFALVWLPGQLTPIHDHGTWGVVGVVEGILEEQAYMRTDATAHEARDTGILLDRAGLVILPAGAVSTFVPNPDHIHETGVPAERPTCVSLHLYGRVLNSFHVYDREAGTRRLIETPHSET